MSTIVQMTVKDASLSGNFFLVFDQSLQRLAYSVLLDKGTSKDNQSRFSSLLPTFQSTATLLYLCLHLTFTITSSLSTFYDCPKASSRSFACLFCIWFGKIPSLKFISSLLILIFLVTACLCCTILTGDHICEHSYNWNLYLGQRAISM